MTVTIAIDLQTIFGVTSAVLACMAFYYWLFYDHSDDSKDDTDT